MPYYPPSGAGGVTSFNTRTGAITLTGADVTGTNVRLDQLTAPTAAVAMNGQKLTGLANGTAASDAGAFGQIPTATSAVSILKWEVS